MDTSPSPSPMSPVPDLYDHDEQMSDVSPSMASSPTETMATISSSTPVGSTSRDEALAIAAAIAFGGLVHPSSYQKQSNTMSVSSGNTDDKMMMHHPYKQYNRLHSVHSSNGVSPATGEAVTITMCPSNDAVNDGFDSSSKKKRKTLTKLCRFFRFETAAKC